MERQKFQEQNATEEEGHGQQLVTGKEADGPIRFGQEECASMDQDGDGADDQNYET